MGEGALGINSQKGTEATQWAVGGFGCEGSRDR